VVVRDSTRAQDVLVVEVCAPLVSRLGTIEAAESARRNVEAS